MQQVFVLSSDHQPLDPCHPARARKLLKERRAAIFRRYPFTIVLKDRTAAESGMHQSTLRIDPGSKVTGIALVGGSQEVVFAAELMHRGQQVHNALATRRAIRRARRSRKCRFREPRFSNRSRIPEWLAPSLQSRVANVITWVNRFRRLCPIGNLAMEFAKFDIQAMMNPEISGIEYQQGTLYGSEIREYLLAKFGCKCVYCGASSVRLQIEHVTPKSRGGTGRIDNLVLACPSCNQAKDNRTAAEFGYPEVQNQAHQSFRDAAVINSTRWVLYRKMKELGMPIECGTGGETAFNRRKLGLPKKHWVDAACVGRLGAEVRVDPNQGWLSIRAVGHGTRKMRNVDKYGFPRGDAKAIKKVRGFMTGDLVRAHVPNGKKAGTYWGRVSVRTTGWFNVRTATALVQGISYRHCRLLHRADGYTYLKGGPTEPHRHESNQSDLSLRK